MSSEWHAEPLPVHEIESRIGQKSRRLPKQGTCKRLFGNCKELAVYACLLTLSVTQGMCDVSGRFAEAMFGSDRPDVVEILGGHAEVSVQFSRRGWNSMQPIDVVNGDDLRDEATRSYS